MSNGPFEPAAGQDDPPDTRQAIIVALVLLQDVRRFLDNEDDHPEERVRLLARIGAVVAVLRRIRDRLEVVDNGSE